MSVLILPGTALTDPSFTNEMVLEEALDALDPLRHYSSCDVSESVLPMQPQTAVKEIVDLSFGGHISTEHREQLSIRLAVDSSPGCGGIAWPAGQVNYYYLL